MKNNIGVALIPVLVIVLGVIIGVGAYFVSTRQITTVNILRINPPIATIGVGATTTFQVSIYHGECPTPQSCSEHYSPPTVQATWTSSNSNVAFVRYKGDCNPAPVGTACLPYSLDYLTAEVLGISSGTATITATYTNSSGNVLTATSSVTVTNSQISTISTTPTTSLKTYLNNQYGFSIQYPNNFRKSETNDGGFFNELNIFSASIDVPIGYQNGTDFNVGRITIMVSPTTSKCYSSQGSDEDMTATKIINGKSFRYNPKQPIDDAAMGGQRGSDSLFVIIENGQCYRIAKLVGYRDPRGFTDPPYPPHFDEQKVNADLDAIVSSFVFK